MILTYRQSQLLAGSLKRDRQQQELQASGDEAWEDLKAGAKNAWDEVKSAFHDAATKFK